MSVPLDLVRADFDRIGTLSSASPLDRSNRIALGKLRPGARSILEVGCGTGALSEHLAVQTDHLVAIDASPVMARTTAKRCPRAEVIETRVTHTKKSRSAFDGYNRGRQWEITCAEVAKLRIARVRDPHHDVIASPMAAGATNGNVEPCTNDLGPVVVQSKKTVEISVASESGRRDSNPRRQPWQGCTLPLSYSRNGRAHF
jgi:SAM-dependent methyltransferase